MRDFEDEYYRADAEKRAAEAKLAKILDLVRARAKGEPDAAVLDNIQKVLWDQPLVNEPTWAYDH